MRKFPTHVTSSRFGRALLATAALVTMSTSMALSQPDVMMRDCYSDIGNQPNNDCGSAIWNSPDIVVRNNQGQSSIHENPVFGQTNYVYVTLKNIGGSTLGRGVVHLYFGKASTSLSNWPERWINYSIGGVIYGDEIGSACVEDLCPGCTTTVEIPWVNVPDPNNYNDPDAHHFCLIARFKSVEDPMAFPEGLLIYDNTRNNNNIAWKNCHIVRPSTPVAPVEVYNGRTEDVVANLKFDVVDEEKANILDVATVRVDLGPELFARWREGGSDGEGVEQDGENTLRITSAHARIGKITLPAGAGATIHAKVEISREGQDKAKAAGIDLYRWRISQGEEGREDPIGGNDYDIHPTDEEGNGKAVRRPTLDLGGKLDLGAQPNFSKAETTIGFTLPAESRVTLAIYDASGHLVRTLIADEHQAAGRHEVSWNGAEANGSRVAAGTYFYRIVTPEGTAEKQIKIVR